MKRRLFVASVCLLAISVAAPRLAWADKLADITSAGTVKVAVLAEYPPYGSVGPDMQPVGLDIDLANIISEKLGVKPEFLATTGPNRIPYLQTGKVDIIIGCLGRNPEREKVIDYGPAYSADFNAVFGPEDAKISTAKDFVGKTVAVVRGSTEDLGFSAIAPEGVIIKRFEDNNGTQSAYQSGQVEFVVTSGTVAAVLNKSNSKKLSMKIQLGGDEDERAYIGLSKNEPALKQKLNDMVDGLKKDGTLSKLSMKWLGSDIPKDL